MISEFTFRNNGVVPQGCFGYENGMAGREKKSNESDRELGTIVKWVEKVGGGTKARVSHVIFIQHSTEPSWFRVFFAPNTRATRIRIALRDVSNKGRTFVFFSFFSFYIWYHTSRVYYSRHPERAKPLRRIITRARILIKNFASTVKRLSIGIRNAYIGAGTPEFFICRGDESQRERERKINISNVPREQRVRDDLGKHDFRNLCEII